MTCAQNILTLPRQREKTERKLVVDHLVHCLPEVTYSVMTLKFENGNYF